ncbi:MAG TPA: hypothetical protein VGN47_16985, partial [Blastococcus sp.]|nr:hypothetical protein [Blastococcus sp.]
MPGAGDAQPGVACVELEVAAGDGVVTPAGLGAGQCAGLPHQRGGADPVAGDVADEQTELPAGQPEGVVPVAAG